MSPTSTQPNLTGRANRIHSIDAFRVFANLAIVWVHTGPFMTAGFDPHVHFIGELLNQFVRVATPFFFLASGYFFSVSLSRGAAPVAIGTKLVQRLALLAIFWSCVYILLPIGKMMEPPYPSYGAAVLLLFKASLRPSVVLTGTAVQLWFLPALACALVLLTAACRYRVEKYVATLGAALFVLGLLGGSYAITPVGFHIGLNTRNGPFFSTVFVFTGYLLHKYGINLSLRTAYLLILGGVALRLTEIYSLTMWYDADPSKLDYLLGTYPFSVGVFVWLLNSPRLGDNRWLVRLSRYSPGVYCGHILLVALFSGLALFPGNALWEITRPFLILGLTFTWVIILGRVRLFRPVVT